MKEGTPPRGSPLDYAMDQQSRITLPAVRLAVEKGNGVLAYQPIVQAAQPGRPAFYEGLIRIIDDSGRIVPLRDFMPVAETTELGRQIDCLSLSLGLQALAEDPCLRLSVNMSARSIGYPDWIRTLRDGISADPHMGERLILEITESSAMGMPDQVRNFMREVQRSHKATLDLEKSPPPHPVFSDVLSVWYRRNRSASALGGWRKADAV